MASPLFIYSKRIVSCVALVLVVILTIMLVRACSLSSLQSNVSSIEKWEISDSCIQNLSQSIRFPTISSIDSHRMDSLVFQRFHAFLAQTFPHLHQKLPKEVVNGLGLLYFWPGSHTDRKPILLLAHQDVVIVEAGTEKDWTCSAFSGEVKDGFVWGRGTLDDKGSMMAIMEAVEYLLQKGYQPTRGIYLAFGFDEESKGERGAREIARLLKSRKVSLDFVLDEGGCVSKGLVPFVEKPVALVGIAEKGYLSLEIIARGKGGHSSMPPRQTSAGILSDAICRIEASPFAARLDGATELFFQTLAPEMPLRYKMVMANLWICKPLLLNILSNSSSTNSVIRTTNAVTMLEGSQADNVLPQQSKAVVNLRILPGETAQSAQKRLQQLVENESVSVVYNPFWASSEPSRISDIGHDGYRCIEKSVRQIFPETLVAPFLVVATTDSRYFQDLTDNIYRFVPIVMDSKDLDRIHSTNERIGVEPYKDTIRFYIKLIENSSY